MRTVAGRLCRVVVVALAILAVSRILQQLATPRGDHAVVPPVTGDTWPPVPVKSSR